MASMSIVGLYTFLSIVLYFMEHEKMVYRSIKYNVAQSIL